MKISTLDSDSAPTAVPGWVEVVGSRAREFVARRLVAAAQAILSGGPPFEDAFPFDETEPAQAAESILAAVVRLNSVTPANPSTRLGLERLLEQIRLPEDDHSDHSPIQLALRLLDAASNVDPDCSAPWLVRAQAHWVFEPQEAVLPALDRCLGLVRSSGSASSALLHLALHRADHDQFDDAVASLEHAVRLRPRALAPRWTLAIYRAASGSTATAREHLRIAVLAGSPHAVRERLSRLDRHLIALADRGVLRRSRVPIVLRRIRSFVGILVGAVERR